LDGNPKVVAALAAVILLAPPVVNAIMEKAARQVDVEWLRGFDGRLDPEVYPDDADFDPDQIPPGTPPPDLPDRPPPGTPPAGCTPVAQRSADASLDTLDLRRRDAIEITADAATIAVLVTVHGRNVTGGPEVVLIKDGQTHAAWVPTPPMQAEHWYPQGEATRAYAGGPATWTLRYDLTRATYTSVDLTLVAVTCAEARP